MFNKMFIKAEMLFADGKFVKAIRAYDKLLLRYPRSELHDVVLDRKFAIGTLFLGGHKKRVLKIFKIKGYAEGAKIMERVSDAAGDAPLAVAAAVAVAQSLEKRGKYNDAYHKWSEISSRWPTGKIGKDALLAMGRCKHAAYRGPKYDSSGLISAKSYYENFRMRHPQEAKALDIGEKLEYIEEQSSFKQFKIGRYYQKTDNNQSARIYYQKVIANWPGSTGAKMAQVEMDAINSNKE